MKRFSLEIEFSIDHVPYICLAEGDDVEELLENAEYNHKDSDNGNNYRHIGNLPQSQFDTLEEAIIEEVRYREELIAESIRS